MSHSSAPGAPWRVLVLDRDPADPKWLFSTVALPADVRPAVLDAAGRYADWTAVVQWMASLTGSPVALVPVQDALAWRVDEGTAATVKPSR